MNGIKRCALKHNAVARNGQSTADFVRAEGDKNNPAASGLSGINCGLYRRRVVRHPIPDRAKIFNADGLAQFGLDGRCNCAGAGWQIPYAVTA